MLGAITFRQFTQMLADSTEDSDVRDPWVTAMRALPTTVLSTTLFEPLDWPDATVVDDDPVDAVRRLKEESPVPLRSHGSLLLNRALLAAGLVDRLQVTVFPVVTGRTGQQPVFEGAEDLDLEPAGAARPRRAHARGSPTGRPCTDPPEAARDDRPLASPPWPCTPPTAPTWTRAACCAWRRTRPPAAPGGSRGGG
ncbi:hypothetical protein GCM10025868_35660 [Angustibacter aerolatus]|uniref:Bacterial bifunctional deaminase-reductase C-terminal domain-containing protein n=1 Tax=Angustibacter aerolatus TaxID=1162965 RepID=A0ABQ6JJ83_9ACTN|nr:hypothetical protein GCM10025868_35660 [Angustibacter aerolatus]